MDAMIIGLDDGRGGGPGRGPGARQASWAVAGAGRGDALPWHGRMAAARDEARARHAAAEAGRDAEALRPGRGRPGAGSPAS